jgi:hypothetical protein
VAFSASLPLLKPDPAMLVSSGLVMIYIAPVLMNGMGHIKKRKMSQVRMKSYTMHRQDLFLVRGIQTVYNGNGIHLNTELRNPGRFSDWLSLVNIGPFSMWVFGDKSA